MALFKRKSKEPKNTADSNGVEYSADLLEAMLKGEELTKQQALGIPAVASAVDKIANTVAMIPIKLYKETKTDDNKRVVTEVEDKRVAILNQDTKSTLDGFQFKKAMVTDYLMGKGGYAYIKRRKNEFVGVYYVREEDIALCLINESPIDRRYTISTWGKMYEPFEFLKILRNSKDGMLGFGVSSQVAQALSIALQTMILQYNLAKTGGNKRGYIQSENVLSDKAIDKLKEAWAEMYANNDTQRIPVLNKGLSFQQSSATSVEMQLNESKELLNKEIAKLFHTDGDYNDFFKNAVQPILTEFETALNRDFLLEKEKGILFWAFDTTDITKSGLKERYEAYKTALDGGWVTKNEIRYRENMDAIDGLDTINMGLGSVLFDTKTGEYYTPNTNSTHKVGESTQNNDANVQKDSTNEQKNEKNAQQSEQNGSNE